MAFRLKENNAGPFGLVVCGGSALILTGAVPRTTKDVDVVALMENDRLSSPQPLPEDLLQAVREVAADEDLMEDWLNNGPSKDPQMGLFQGGLPEGFGGAADPPGVWRSAVRIFHWQDRPDFFQSVCRRGPRWVSCGRSSCLETNHRRTGRRSALGKEPRSLQWIFYDDKKHVATNWIPRCS